MQYLIAAFLSYVIGSIPNGLIIGKLLKGVDLRNFGSKNIGATNAFRVLGPWPALLVFLADMTKGLLGVYLGQYLTGTSVGQLVGGIFAITGHNWSLFLGFKGGRGVATGLGVIAVLVPKVTAIIFIIWAVIVYFTRYVSLGSIIAAGLLPVFIWLFDEKSEYLYFGILAGLFVIIRHKPNIKRLLKGQELKIKAGGSAIPKEKEK